MKLILKYISIHYLKYTKIIYVFFPITESISTFTLKDYREMTKKLE